MNRFEFAALYAQVASLDTAFSKAGFKAKSIGLLESLLHSKNNNLPLSLGIYLHSSHNNASFASVNPSGAKDVRKARNAFKKMLELNYWPIPEGKPKVTAIQASTIELSHQGCIEKTPKFIELGRFMLDRITAENTFLTPLTRLHYYYDEIAKAQVMWKAWEKAGQLAANLQEEGLDIGLGYAVNAEEVAKSWCEYYAELNSEAANLVHEMDPSYRRTMI